MRSVTEIIQAVINPETGKYANYDMNRFECWMILPDGKKEIIGWFTMDSSEQYQREAEKMIWESILPLGRIE